MRVHLVRGLQDRIFDAEGLAESSRRLAEHALAHDCHPFDGGHEVDGSVLRHLADT
jgi:hypothetical protein